MARLKGAESQETRRAPESLNRPASVITNPGPTKNERRSKEAAGLGKEGKSVAQRRFVGSYMGSLKKDSVKKKGI